MKIRRNLDSSCIQRVVYDEETKELVVTFTSGRRYSYDDVPRKAFFDLINAPSVGRHFNSYVSYGYNYHALN